MEAIDIRELHRKVVGILESDFTPFDAAFMPEDWKARYPASVFEEGSGYYLYLNALVRTLQARRVLELGTNGGLTTSFMLAGMEKDSLVITIDAASPHNRVPAHLVEDSRVRLFTGDDLDLRSYRGLDLRAIDLLFVDAEHSYRHVFSQWALYKQFLSPSALVVMDDIHLNPQMERFWDELPFPKLDLGNLFHWSGLGLVQAPSAWSKEVYDFFRLRMALYKKCVTLRKSTMDGYSTHYPLLAACVARTTGPVLELGCGDYSTPMLHLLCKNRRLVSADGTADWLSKYGELRTPNHEFHLIRDWDACKLLDEHEWDVVFVDHAPVERRVREIRRLKDRARFIVVHDTEDPLYCFETVFPDFKYRYDYTFLDPWTTVVSMHHPFES